MGCPRDRVNKEWELEGGAGASAPERRTGKRGAREWENKVLNLRPLLCVLVWR